MFDEFMKKTSTWWIKRQLEETEKKIEDKENQGPNAWDGLMNSVPVLLMKREGFKRALEELNKP